jgi:AcrR family transcriptional regulator
MMGEKTARGSLTREKLVAAALEVFRRRGYAQATTREIAQAANVAEGTIYRHFPDKQALFHAVFVESVGGLRDELRRFQERAGTGTLRDNLSALLELLGSRQEAIHSLMASLAADEELAESFKRHVQGEGHEGFDPTMPMTATAAYVAAEQQAGRIRGDLDPGEAAMLIVALPFAQGMARALGADPRQLPIASGEQAAVDVLVRGLARR